MISPQTVQSRCVSCGLPVSIEVLDIIDVQSNPNAKSLLLTEQLNIADCPNCGTLNKAVSPLLYHDADKELLIAFVPMELGASNAQDQEKLIGSMMNRLTASLPEGSFKAYMFNPRRAISMQGMIEQIMEADGVSPEMLAQQRQRMNILQQMISSPSPEGMQTLITENDELIDETFFQTLTLTAQRMMEEGQQPVVQRLAMIQAIAFEHSTVGKELAKAQEKQEQMLAEMLEEIQALGEDASHEDFRNLVVKYADDDERIQAIVGLIRPVFDYDFFQEFTVVISQAPAEERDKLSTLRDRLLQLIEMVDQSAQDTIRQSAQFLQSLVNSPEPQALLEANPQLIDDDFMNVLVANLQEADRRQDTEMFTRLRTIYDMVMQIVQSQMSPELRFINQVLSTEDETEARQVITDNIDNLDESLPAVIDQVGQILTERGQTQSLERLTWIREALT